MTFLKTIRFWRSNPPTFSPRITLVLDDITLQDVDAVVNAADWTLLGGTGVDGALHEAAGTELAAACRALGGCKTGEAKITSGFALKARHIIHTVAPVYHESDQVGQQQRNLAHCYRSCLKLADTRGMMSIAFPSLGAGGFGWRIEDVVQIAVDTIKGFRGSSLQEVRLVAFSERAFTTYERIGGLTGERIAREKPFRYHPGISATGR